MKEKDASKIPEKTLNKISEGKKLTGSRFSDRHPVSVPWLTTSLYFSSFQDEQKSETKRSLLPVVNINTGKREDRFEELKTRELQDLESESESEDEEIPTEEKDLTIEQIKKLQNEQLVQWRKRLVQVLTYLYTILSLYDFYIELTFISDFVDLITEKVKLTGV